MGRLVRTRRSRGQLVITLNRPSFKTSQRYYRLWRQTQAHRQPHHHNGVAAYGLLAIGLGGMVYGLVQLGGLQPTTPQVFAVTEAPKPVSIQQPKPPSMARALPAHLLIPDIAIDTSLIQLGQNEDGTLETPQAYDVAGWYRYSPTPGEIGPSVLVGHVDNYQGAAVFYRLKELQVGQLIAVTREDGTVATFAVTRVDQYDQDHFPTTAVYGNTAGAELRLITCGGPFNHLTGEYTQNTVVYATYVAPNT